MKNQKQTLLFTGYILVVALLFFSGCKSAGQDAGTNNVAAGKIIQSSQAIVNYDSLSVYDPFKTSNGQKEEQPGFTIVSYINVSCPSCIVEIDKWNEFIGDMKSKDCKVKLVLYSKDNFEYIKYLFESNELKKFPHILYLDTKNVFDRNNPLFNEFDTDKTVLTDKENIVILKGNPLHSKEMKAAYLEAIQKKG